jgi:hypothetical protein
MNLKTYLFISEIEHFKIHQIIYPIVNKISYLQNDVKIYF